MEINFVLCPSYHGATLLALLLNNHSRISSLGDAIPRRSYDQRCACKKLVSQCEFWQHIERELDTQRFIGQEFLFPLYPEIFNNSTLNKLFHYILGEVSLYINKNVLRLLGWKGEEYVRTYSAFYQTVCSLHHTEIFVEGSKNIIEALLFYSLAKEESLKIIHLSRDPRGYFYSLKKYYPHVKIKKAAKRWRQYHGIVQKLQDSFHDSRYFFLRYEDLSQEPEKWMQRTFDFLGVENQDVCHSPFNSQKNHLMGNKMIFSFDGTIRYNNLWNKYLSCEEQDKMLELTRPLSLRFGYVKN